MKKQVVLITGASSGFGMLAAIEMAKRGFDVWASMRNIAKKGELEKRAAEAKVDVKIVQLDVVDAASVEAALQKVGHIDVLVNNAGINCGIGYFEEVPAEDFNNVMRTNFEGPVAVTRAVLPQMRRRGSGRIIQISSIYGFMACTAGSAYTASKWALEGFSEALRQEVDAFGVKVSLIQPGYFKTPLLSDNMAFAPAALDPNSPYASAFAAGTKIFAEKLVPKAGDPQVVAELIADVAQEKSPKLRYVVGKDGKLLRRMRSLLPHSTWENIFIDVVRKALKEKAPARERDGANV